MHLFQSVAVDVSINLRCCDISVAQHRLHRAEVGAAFEEMRRKRMAKHVR